MFLDFAVVATVYGCGAREGYSWLYSCCSAFVRFGPIACATSDTWWLQHIAGRLWYPSPKEVRSQWFGGYKQCSWLPSYNYAYGEDPAPHSVAKYAVHAFAVMWLTGLLRHRLHQLSLPQKQRVPEVHKASIHFNSVCHWQKPSCASISGEHHTSLLHCRSTLAVLPSGAFGDASSGDLLSACAAGPACKAES